MPFPIMTHCSVSEKEKKINLLEELMNEHKRSVGVVQQAVFYSLGNFKTNSS